MRISLRAAAKINLFLDILGKNRADYHEISTVMQSVSLYDVITVERREDRSNILLKGDLDYTANIEDNTVYRAAEVFFEYAKINRAGLEITINKNIPICAGLAGGSADAAATLLALNKLFKAQLSCEQLREMGKKVGTDVPFCISGGTALAEGIGTKLRPLRPLTPVFFVIVKPDFEISTKKAYELYDRFGLNSSQKNITQLLGSIDGRDIKKLANCLFNRFEDILSLNPENNKNSHNFDTPVKEIQKLKEKLINEGAIGSCMSGSGTAVFGMFEKESLARKCVDRLNGDYTQLFLCKSIEASCEFL
jgi:4-diphosphocytidyl-2-C-methyl-D-erythritol kinase